MASPAPPDKSRAVLRGVVVHGDKRGRLLGFPTANVAVENTQALPAHGVYCCRIRIGAGAQIYDATCSIGTNPTFDDVFDTRVEAYIHEFDRAIYGERVELLLLERLRDMVRFPDLAALVDQTLRDVEQSRALLRRIAHTSWPS